MADLPVILYHRGLFAENDRLIDLVHNAGADVTVLRPGEIVDPMACAEKGWCTFSSARFARTLAPLVPVRISPDEYVELGLLAREPASPVALAFIGMAKEAFGNAGVGQ